MMTGTVRTLREDVEAAVVGAVRRVTGPGAEVDPLVRRSERADFQSNVALSLANSLGQRPAVLAQAVRDELAARNTWLADITVSGPGFLNIRLTDAALTGRLTQRLADPVRLGVPCSREGEVTVVDYSGPNVAKEMHVGHLRSTLIGDCLARTLAFLGADVIRRNHVGDWGTNFGMLIQYLLEHPDLPWRERDLAPAGGESAAPADSPAASAASPVSALDELYRAARVVFDADPAFKERSQRRVVALQAGDEAAVAAWREIVTESTAAFQRVYARLGVLLTLDDVAGESSYNPELAGVLGELQDAGIAVESEGAWCVFYDDIRGHDDRPVPLLLRKSDGGFGYAVTDLAAVRHRVRDLKATRVLYMVDARQGQHFTMVFRTARRAGWFGDEVETAHVRNGTINGPDGRPFRTRAGGTVRLEDLLDAAERRAAQVLAEKAPDTGPAELARIARLAGIGAVKYAELSTSRLKNYNFDVDQMVSFTGQTGVYLQYTHARIASILRRAADDDAAGFAPGAELEPAERELALLLDEFPATVDAVAGTLEPHRLAGYLYALAKTYTAFYESCPVLKSAPAVRATRLALCRLTAATLSQGLTLLGITAPDRM
jgi:arginyl-tRNA synthetase